MINSLTPIEVFNKVCRFLKKYNQIQKSQFFLVIPGCIAGQQKLNVIQTQALIQD